MYRNGVGSDEWGGILMSVYHTIYMYWDSLVLFCVLGQPGVALWVQVWWPTAQFVAAYK